MKVSKLFQRILLLFIGLYGAVALSISLISAYIVHEKLLEEHKTKALSIARSVSNSSLDVLLNKDATTIQSLIDQMMSIEGVSYLFYQSTDGEIIAHTFVPMIPHPVREMVHTMRDIRPEDNLEISTLAFPGQKRFMNVASPILAGEAGFLHIGMDLQQVHDYIWGVIGKIQAATLVLFLLSVLISYFLVDRISRPLNELTAYANRVAAHDFSAGVSIKTDDEIGILARNMQLMGKELEKFIHELEGSVREATSDREDTLNHLQVILNNIADGLVVFDSRGTILQHNDQLVNMLSLKDRDMSGLNIKELLGKGVSDILEPERTEKNGGRQVALPAIPGENPARGIEITVHRADGTDFPVELSISGVHTKNGLHYISIIRDITTRKTAEEKLQKIHSELENKVEERTRELTESNKHLIQEIRERKRAEDALAAEKELLTTTLKSIGDGVITTDIQGRVVLMNKVAEKLTGVTQNIARGQELRTVYRVFKTTGPNPSKEADLLQKHVLLEKNSGGRIHIAQTVSPIVDQQSSIIGAVVVFKDITREKRQEEEHLKSEKLSSLGILAGGIAHDFNNILTTILNNLNMSRLHTEKDQVLKNLKQAETASLRAQKLANQLLTFSKGGSPIKEVTCIKTLLEEAVAFVIRGTNIKGDIQVPDSIWPVEVDQGQIIQVLDNLIINAIQAMPEGGVITVRAENCNLGEAADVPLPPGCYIRLSIEDQGHGIPPEYMEQIFDPYFTTKKRGSGLGLATTYSIIKNHNGHVGVESVLGKGTMFSLYLPALSEHCMVSDKNRSVQISSGTGRVLIMDDEESLQEILADALEYLGYEAMFAADGEEALQVYAASRDEGHPIDVVIMDLTIPGGMGGKETIAELLKIDPNARVIVSSGYSQDPVMSNFEEYGFQDVLLKPYSIEEFSQKLRTLLRS